MYSIESVVPLSPSLSAPAFPINSRPSLAEWIDTSCLSEDSFCPYAIKTILAVYYTLFRVLFIYTAHEALRPDHWDHHLLSVSVHICKHIKAEIQLSFFWPSLLTKSTAFMVWGYVKEQHPFNLQHSCLLHRKHLFEPRPGRANLTALQSSGLLECTSNFILSICSSKG